MNREKYLDELEKYLSRLSAEERQNAMDYYREYTAELEESGEDILVKLGTPQELANSIMGEQALRDLDDPKGGTRGRIGGFGLALLVIFALPIGLPLAIAVAAVALAILIVVIAVVFALAASVAAILATGIVSVIASVVLWITAPVTGLFFTGVGMFMVGFSLIGGWLVFKLWCLSFRLIRQFFHAVFYRNKNRQREVQ
ncbi:MAG: DUF1700 domain-containing protein [Wujia sp.]